MEPATRRSWKLQEFVAHRANVNCLAMGHKSNQVLATGGDDKKVNLWAIGRHSCLMSLSGHTTPVECVCFGHSEDLVCAGSQTGALKIWDLEAAKLLRTFTGHKGAIKCMDFHPYGDYLTTGACDSNIKLWDTRQRGCIVTYAGHRLHVNSLQFSPDGQWIASACEDGTVLVWDVRAGRVLRELDQHAAPVSCVKFHPHEFLLATAATDRTLHFYDMENFQLVSKLQKDNTSIRHMLFSDDGRALLGAGSDGLHVVGWEPARVLDTAPAVWGPIHDLTVAHNQLIAGSFHATYVVLSVVDLKKVYPFGGPAPPSPPGVTDPSPFHKGQTVRKSFSKERPPKQLMHASTMLDEKTLEESTSGTEAEEDSVNRTPPPSTSLEPDIPEAMSPTRNTGLRDLSMSDYTATMAPQTLGEHNPLVAGPLSLRQARNKDLYSKIPTSTKEYAHVAEKTKADMSIRRSESVDMTTYVNLATLTSRPAQETCTVLPHSALTRQHSYKEKSVHNYANSSLRSSNSEMSLGPPSLGPRSLSFTKPVSESTRNKADVTVVSRDRRANSPGVEIYERPPQRTTPRSQTTPEPEFVPIATDKPIGLDLDEFLPRERGCHAGRGAVGEPSEQEVLGVLMRGHDSMMTVLVGRQRALQIFHSVRTNRTLKSALESTIALEDDAVLADILNVMVHKPSLWNLDICLLLLPKTQDLLQSKYETYMTCGCNVLRLIIRNFSSVIKTNVNSPVRSLGVDIPREERYNKCVQIHQLLLDIRAFLLKRQTMQGRLGAAFRDLHTLIQQGLEG